MKNPTYPIIMENLKRFTIADLKKLGYFVPDGVVSGVLRWGSGDNQSSIRAKMDNARMVLSLKYMVNNEKIMQYDVAIIEKAANLGKGVVRFFLCPITHKPCRKLYLYGDRFVSRRAMRNVMYRDQTESKIARLIPFGMDNGAKNPQRRYGKPYYRGKITPYGKRLERYEKKCDHADMVIATHFYRSLQRHFRRRW